MSEIVIKDHLNRYVKVYLHQNDLPDNVTWSNEVAIDTEFTGLNFHHDYLCLIQLRLNAEGPIHLIQVSDRTFNSPNICGLLTDNKTTKIGHYIVSDLIYLYKAYSVIVENVWCTYVASKLSRSYANSHSLVDNCLELLSVNINKQERATDWGAEHLSDKQQAYAATDVLYLHELKKRLSEKLERRGAWMAFNSVQKIIPHKAYLDIIGCHDILHRYHSRY